jgi:hypothetical protein
MKQTVDGFENLCVCFVFIFRYMNICDASEKRQLFYHTRIEIHVIQIISQDLSALVCYAKC